MDFNEYLYKFYGGIGADDLTDDDYDMFWNEYQEYLYQEDLKREYMKEETE